MSLVDTKVNATSTDNSRKSDRSAKLGKDAQQVQAGAKSKIQIDGGSAKVAMIAKAAIKAAANTSKAAIIGGSSTAKSAIAADAGGGIDLKDPVTLGVIVAAIFTLWFVARN